DTAKRVGGLPGGGRPYGGVWPAGPGGGSRQEGGGGGPGTQGARGGGGGGGERGAGGGGGGGGGVGGGGGGGRGGGRGEGGAEGVGDGWLGTGRGREPGVRVAEPGSAKRVGCPVAGGRMGLSGRRGQEMGVSWQGGAGSPVNRGCPAGPSWETRGERGGRG